ncbi:MAG: alanine racemase [Treponema sp.]|nr:alanine racemase [Treponema sp.]
MQATRAIIHLDNLCGNIEAARDRIGPHPKICFPVKADAYGHGVIPVSRRALEAGVEYLAVATVAEGAELRAAGIGAPILILSQALPEALPEIVSQEFIPFVSDDEFIEAAARAAKQAGKKLTVHLKIDTGMGRLGCRPEEAAALARKIASNPGLSLGGIATHLSVADSSEPDHIAYTKGQLRRFREAIEAVKKAGVDPGIVHAANSGALVFHEDSYFDMIRPGIFLYGYLPTAAPAGLSVKAVMELCSKVVLVKKLKAGESASYGNTWTAAEDTFIGVIPGGYADGVRRGLSNNHSVLIRGKAYPLAGRICMDQFMVNLGCETEVERWDDAVIFGPGFITAGGVSEKLGTIPYEITCGINKRVPREYVG